MIADDLITREELTPARMGVKYRVTPYGRSLGPVFTTLWRWGARHLARTGAEHGTVRMPPAGRRPTP
jgi:DNA-binding HxlR family transcriptional regulator